MTVLGDGWIRGPQWASPASRAEWEDRIAAAAAAWEELEVMSVTSGIRPSALIYLTPDELVRATAEAAAQGLQVVALSIEGGQIRAALCPPQLAGVWSAAWRSGDDRAIGDLLGFPACCREFFHQTWVERGWRDSTPAMGMGGTADGPIGANILLRRLGVRLVPHLPCSFTCAATAELAAQMVQAAIHARLEDFQEIENLLSLPMAWSACNGAAVLQVADLFRVAYQTDDSDAPRNRLQRHAGGSVPALQPPAWRDNDFSSRAAMSAAHAVIAGVVGPVDSALDLGAGDGSLLERISGHRRGTWLAVEVDPGRVQRGRARRPGLKFTESRLEDPELTILFQADVALFMPGRLQEMDAAAAARVRDMLGAQRIGRRLVLYVYGDWLADGGLARLFVESGIDGNLGPISAGAGAGVQAAEVIWP